MPRFDIFSLEAAGVPVAWIDTPGRMPIVRRTGRVFEIEYSVPGGRRGEVRRIESAAARALAVKTFEKWGLHRALRLAGARAGDMTLEYVALVPAWQRRGVGSGLVRDVQRRAAERGLSVRLSVLRPNPARWLYERLGFQVVAEDDTRIRMEWREGGDGTARLGDAADRGAVADGDSASGRRGVRGG